MDSRTRRAPRGSDRDAPRRLRFRSSEVPRFQTRLIPECCLLSAASFQRAAYCGYDEGVANDLPIACTLTPDALSARKAGLLARVLLQATERVDIENGVCLRFPAGSFADVAAVIDAERACCRFLQFTLVVEPDGGPLSLTLTGPPGTRDFVDALLDDPRVGH